MPATGPAAFPKPKQPPPAPKSAKNFASSVLKPADGSDPVEPRSEGRSYASRIPDLCMSLGFPAPVYVMEGHKDFPSMYSGYAHFGGDPRVSGKIGEFFNVYGKKKAKEQCAAEVVSFMESVRAQRIELDERAKAAEEDNEDDM
jgi:hypothetical protein